MGEDDRMTAVIRMLPMAFYEMVEDDGLRMRFRRIPDEEMAVTPDECWEPE